MATVMAVMFPIDGMVQASGCSFLLGMCKHMMTLLFLGVM